MDRQELYRELALDLWNRALKLVGSDAGVSAFGIGSHIGRVEACVRGRLDPLLDRLEKAESQLQAIADQGYIGHDNSPAAIVAFADRLVDMARRGLPGGLEPGDPCPTCGWPLEPLPCPECHGEGGWHNCMEDSCCCLDKDEITDICPLCEGTGDALQCSRERCGFVAQVARPDERALSSGGDTT